MTVTMLDIGSDMELPQDKYRTEYRSDPLWALGHEIAYVQTGGQALKLVSELFWADGARDLIVPEYLCDSMLAPFLFKPWRIVSVAVGRDLAIDLDDLVMKAQSLSGRFAVLTALYFGRLPHAEYREAIDKIRALGGLVVEDETHRPFSPGGSAADVAVASLRKVLPVADGAYIRGAVATQIAWQELPEGSSDGWAAMKLKTEFLAGSSDAVAYRQRFAKANTELTQLDVVKGPSAQTMRVIHQLDYSRLANARRANYESLRHALSGLPSVRVLDALNGGVPSHLVLHVDGDSRALQRELAMRGLYCPIHWPPSRLLEQGRAWPSGYLSVPVDHRYEPAEMVEAGSVIKGVVGG